MTREEFAQAARRGGYARYGEIKLYLRQVAPAQTEFADEDFVTLHRWAQAQYAWWDRPGKTDCLIEDRRHYRTTKTDRE